jgi:hypothetical protein
MESLKDIKKRIMAKVDFLIKPTKFVGKHAVGGITYSDGTSKKIFIKNGKEYVKLFKNYYSSDRAIKEDDKGLSISGFMVNELDGIATINLTERHLEVCYCGKCIYVKEGIKEFDEVINRWWSLVKENEEYISSIPAVKEYEDKFLEKAEKDIENLKGFILYKKELEAEAMELYNKYYKGNEIITERKKQSDSWSFMGKSGGSEGVVKVMLPKDYSQELLDKLYQKYGSSDFDVTDVYKALYKIITGKRY